MRKHLNNLYVQYVLTAIFCFGFFCVPPHIFFCYLTHCVSWQFTFLDTCVSWHLCFLTLWVSGDKDLYIFFFLRLFFFFFFVPFFFSRVFLFLIISREHHICMVLGFVFFFFFFFFSRQLIYENTSITRIYINNRQILVRFFFLYILPNIFLFLETLCFFVSEDKVLNIFFFSRRCISVFHGFFSSFFFWTISVGVFDISKFSACFSFFFFSCCFSIVEISCYYSLL